MADWRAAQELSPYLSDALSEESDLTTCDICGDRACYLYNTNPSFYQPEENKAVENLEGAIEHFLALYEELALDITDRERVRIMGEINARSNGKLL